MQVFNTFFKILRKRATTMVLYVIIFLFLSILMSSFAHKTLDDSFQQKELDIAVIDRNQTESSKALTTYLDSLHNIIPIEDDTEAFTDELFARTVKYILIIPDDYEKNLQAGHYDDLLEHYTIPDSTNALFIDMQIEQYLNTMSAYLTADMDIKDVFKECNDTMAKETEVTIYHDENAIVTDKDNLYYSFLYLPYIFVCIMLVAVGPILGIMNSKELKNRMNVSCMKNSVKNFQLGLATLVAGTGISIIFFAMSYFTSKESLFTKTGLLYMGNAYSLMFVAIAITYLLSQLTNNESILNMVANIFGLGSCFLCGIFVPIEYLSPKVTTFSKFLPPYWYAKCSNLIASYNGEANQLQEIFQHYGILICFAVAIFAVALIISKTKRERS